MTSLWCVECGHGNPARNWFEVAEGRWLCGDCAEDVRSVFSLAATLGVGVTDLLLKVCDEA
jgi:uncharacterized protein (UPF0212 family)